MSLWKPLCVHLCLSSLHPPYELVLHSSSLLTTAQRLCLLRGPLCFFFFEDPNHFTAWPSLALLFCIFSFCCIFALTSGLNKAWLSLVSRLLTHWVAPCFGVWVPLDSWPYSPCLILTSGFSMLLILTTPDTLTPSSFFRGPLLIDILIYCAILGKAFDLSVS